MPWIYHASLIPAFFWAQRFLHDAYRLRLGFLIMLHFDNAFSCMHKSHNHFVDVQAALDMTGWPRNWPAAVVRVLEIVTKLPETLPFAEPVPLEEVPGYREQISKPMDLGTILGRAKADAYDTPLETLDDVRQVGYCLCEPDSQ